MTEPIDPYYEDLERRRITRLSLARHSLPTESDRPGPATIDALAELERIHAHLCDGAVVYDDLAFAFQLCQALIFENDVLKARVDDLKNQFVVFATKTTPNFRVAARPTP